MTCVLHVDNLSKEYRLGVHGHGMLFRDVQSWWARFRGKEDPNSPVGLELGARKKTNGRIWALKDVSLEVKQGEVLGIIGRNGAGKSTLLKVLSKVTAPTRGTIKIKGQVASLLEVGTGFHPELTGRENIYLNGAIMGMSVKEVSKKFDEILNFAGVEPFIDTPVKRYSSGMYVRLAFAVAAHLEPEILLVDEVLAVGDVEFQKKCLGKMSDVANEGRTILFVSHNMAAMRKLCERAVLLEDGSIVLDGTPSTAIDRYLEGSSVPQAVLTGLDLHSRIENHYFCSEVLFRCSQIAVIDGLGQPRNRFNSNENIHVAIEFECLKDVYNLQPMVYLDDREGVPLVRTDFLDQGGVEDYRVFKKGLYRLQCVLPKDTFGQKVFYLTVWLICHNIQHLAVRQCMPIEINFQGYGQRLHVADSTESAQAFFRPRIHWKVEVRPADSNVQAPAGL